MRIADMNWQQVAAYLEQDDRAVLPLGCTEQHAALSLSTDSILAERVAVEAAEPLGVPVFPVLPYGITPIMRDYPGTLSLRAETYLRVVRELIEALASSGFRRVVLVNGHGGNTPVQAVADEAMGDLPGLCVRLHNWWNAPRTWAQVQQIDTRASHASWMENFPWTRLAGPVPPGDAKPMVDFAALRQVGPHGLREALGDGSFGGPYQRSDDDMLAIWRVAVEETRAIIAGPWPPTGLKRDGER